MDPDLQRLRVIANVVNTLDVLVIAGLVVAVVVFGKSSALLALAFPGVLISLGVQYLVFRSEAREQE